MSDSENDTTLPDPQEEEQLLRLLEFLHRSRGFDFAGYKRGSLSRRIRRRMAMLGIDSFDTYVDHLQVHPDEFPQLFNLLLINVTAFFRDPPAWQALADRLPEVIEMRGTTPIRIWSAGCSSGEEPYTLAMLLAESLGVEAFTQRVKIYATDLDEDALAHARLAMYSHKALEPVPHTLVEKYFTATGSQFVFNKDLRRSVVFGRHDLVQDAPIPRVDILACRNALMYFNAEMQKRILERLRFALNPRGILFLGKAEMLLTQSEIFTPLDLKRRLFTRTSRGNSRGRDKAASDQHASTRDLADEPRIRLQQAAFDCARSAQIVIDAQGNVALMNTRAANAFGLSAGSVLGQPFQNLEVSFRPVELRSCIEKVRIDRRPIEMKGVERIGPAGEKTFLDIDVTALFTAAGVYAGALLAFSDATHIHQLQADLRRTNDELEAAHQELQATSEELETTNEELQSTVEELETTNEELQSTNEELETMNEELQSTNEELQTINEELRQRGKELNETNAFHANVLASLRVGVVVLDAHVAVRTWNAKMEDMWGVREDEVLGRRFTDLDIGLPVAELRSAIRDCLADAEEVVEILECTNRRGKKVSCRASVVPLKRLDDRGAVVVIEEVKP
jgi:two-component system CheB/CheR fusion protein